MLFEIIKRSPRPVNSLLTPAAAAARGVAMQEGATAGTAELADGSKPFCGFMTRASVVGGPTLGDHIYPGRLELPFHTGLDGSFEFAEQVVVEGATYIDDILANTPLKTLCSFTDGKFGTSAAGQYAEFMLVELPTPEVAGNVRARFITVPATKIPAP